MPRGRKRKTAPTQEVLLEVLLAWVNQWVEANGLYGLINLDTAGRAGIGLILMGVFKCVKCENVFLRDGGQDNLCTECKQKVATES